VVHRNRDRFPGTERGIVYGTCPELPATRGEVHRRHQRQQYEDWWSSDPSTRWQRTGCGLLQQNCPRPRGITVTRRELLPIVKTLENFHKYLYGQEFHLRTDHSALTWLLSFRNLEGLTARWVPRLQEYNFTSQHRQGIRHKADVLSRRPCTEECSHCRKVERTDCQTVRIVATTAADGWDQQALRRKQLADNDIGPLMREMEAGRHPEWKDISDPGPIYKSYWA